MSTKKILKFYLITTLTLTSLSALTFNNSFREYFSGYVSAFNYKYEQEKPSLQAVAKKESQNTDFIYKSNPSEMEFAIQANGAKSLVRAGKKDAEFANFVFKVGAAPIQLKRIIFTIKGVDGSGIRKAYLVNGKDIVATAKIENSRLIFNKIDYSFASDAKTTLTLKVDLDEKLEIGDIIGLEIEKPDDVVLKTEGAEYSLNGTYPMDAKYLSIAKAR